VGDREYLLARADESAERGRLRNLEAWLDPITVRHLEATGIASGWRCLEVGAGGGSIARWIRERVGDSGSVVATDIDTRYLTDLATTVDVRQHDLLADELEVGAYDLVHGRAVLQHLAEPLVGLARMRDAVGPGGWLVVEESDLGMFSMSGSPDAGRATALVHELQQRWASLGVLDSFFGRKVPGLVRELGFEAFAVDAATGVGTRGEPVYDAMRLAWPRLRRAAGAVGLEEDDLVCLDRVWESPSTLAVTMTLFAAWARKPRDPRPS
jgi:SAM-dependent methyltransferase